MATTTAKTATNSVAVNQFKAYKMVLLGDAGVGKSSIARRFVYDTFQEHQEATMGACFHEKEFNIGTHFVKIALWDTAGQEKYSSLAHFYYRDAKAALIVYDVTKSKTFDRAKEWVDELQEKAKGIDVIAVVANKVDMEDRQVYMHNASQYAKERELLYFETSAKQGKGIDDIFVNISNKLATQTAFQEPKKSGDDQKDGATVKLESSKLKAKGKCGCK